MSSEEVAALRLEVQELARAVKHLSLASQLAVAQLSQVSRCLTIATLSVMNDEEEKALAEIGEVTDRLANAAEAMKGAAEKVSGVANAS